MPFISEVPNQAHKRFLGGLHAMRGVEDMPAANGEAVELVYLKHRILAVLAGHVQARRREGG